MTSISSKVLSSTGVISPVEASLFHSVQGFRFISASTYIAVTSRLPLYFSYNGAIASANAWFNSGELPMLSIAGFALSLASFECLVERAMIKSCSSSVHPSFKATAC